MSKTYEDEQAQLKVDIHRLRQEIEVQERQIEDLEKFIQRAHKYEDLQEMTPYALRELVKGIYIEAPDKSSGKRRQGIRISYDLVGFIPVEELMKQETAWPKPCRFCKKQYYFLMTPDHLDESLFLCALFADIKKYFLKSKYWKLFKSKV